jgi:molybdopterin-guanine dinucleotide biosynthesis protein A
VTTYNSTIVGIVLLAGGRSSRMGSDKWMLPLVGKTVIEQIIDTLQPLSTELWVIAANADEAAYPNKFPNLSKRCPDIHISYDSISGIGPLGGISAGLTLCSATHILVAATDMPFPSAELAQRLISLSQSSGAAVSLPKWNERLHPLFAVYHKDCLASLTAYIEGGGRKVMDWIDRLNVIVLEEKQIEQLDPEGIALFNMNRQEDYETVLQMLRTKGNS